MIDMLDAFGELVQRRPWISVGVVVVLNVMAVALWIAFEKKCDAKGRRHSANPPDENMR